MNEEEAENGMNSMPSTKTQRAVKIIGTSAKVGGNYIKYYAKKVVNPSLSKDTLHADNAEDIYASLSELKGSALKMAQMMSMDSAVLPQAYQDKFAMAQYNAPALSYPLVQKSFVKYFGKKPSEIFDTFSKNAVHAASIGQVHKAEIGTQQYAVKIQYPGVAESIQSDLKLIKPLAAQLLKMKTSEMKEYLEEVESKLLEETDYELELKQGQEIAADSKIFTSIRIPQYFPELSNRKILTMEWIDGRMLPKFIQESSPEEKQHIGQTMWDFYLFQMKELRKVHADPHPGNFMVDEDGKLVVLDFGCVKEIPSDFFDLYFQLLKPHILEDVPYLHNLFEKLHFFKPEDTAQERALLDKMLQQMIALLGKPFQNKEFDFSDASYFKEIATMGEGFSKDKEFRKMNNARGSKDAIYIMRTFFGLYSLLHQLGATVKLNYNFE
jgi:predicted unusual protein kinase regulating ubiquinone biosynthesis (AarF/ABC1/UbiB family)